MTYNKLVKRLLRCTSVVKFITTELIRERDCIVRRCRASVIFLKIRFLRKQGRAEAAIGVPTCIYAGIK